MTPSDKIQAIKYLINNRLFSQAVVSISQWKQTCVSQSEHRSSEHLLGTILIQQGDVEAALEKLLATEAALGENIGLSMDIACCHYQLCQWSLWRLRYKKVETLLKDNSIQINKKTKIDALILIGKFYEEEGLIFQAQKLYQQAKKIIPHAETSLLFSCMTQLVRIEATFSLKENVGNFYSELIQIQQQNKTIDFEVELEHALMLGELNLIGPAHASQRLLKVINKSGILEADKSLLLYDYLEECVINKHPIPEGIIALCDTTPPLDDFEKMIFSLIKNSGSEITLNHLMGLASRVSPSSYLRLLTLAIKTLPNYAAEIRNKIHLLLSAIEIQSRHLWNKRIDIFTESSSKMLKFDLQKRTISFESKNIDLSRKRGMLIFAETIAQHEDMSVEQMIEKIWETDYSPDHFHRLRMTAHRMNQLLFDLTSIEKPIEVSADRIKLNPNIKFQCFEN